MTLKRKLYMKSDIRKIKELKNSFIFICILCFFLYYFFIIFYWIFMKQKCLIIWGTWELWKWLWAFLKEHFSQELEVYISGRTKESAQKTAQNLWVSFFSNSLLWVQECDIIIFSVPIHNTVETIKQLAPHIKKWAIVFDITSIKKSPSEALYQYTPKECLIIPTHPMFGPSLKSIAWQIIILTPTIDISTDTRYKIFRSYLEKFQMKIIDTTPEQHDKMMAIVQWLTHYSMFVIGNTIKNYGINLNDTFQFVSPIYKLMISSVSRYIWQPAWLYADIQINNPEIQNVHQVFQTTAQQFNAIVQEEKKDDFIKLIEETRDYFWKENCELWQNYTDKIIFLLGKEKEKFQWNIGKHITIENIYSPKEISGILQEFTDTHIIIDNNSYNINTRTLKI